MHGQGGDIIHRLGPWYWKSPVGQPHDEAAGPAVWVAQTAVLLTRFPWTYRLDYVKFAEKWKQIFRSYKYVLELSGRCGALSKGERHVFLSIGGHEGSALLLAACMGGSRCIGSPPAVRYISCGS